MLNKSELCAALKISKPTLDSWIRKHPDFPIEHIGKTSGGWGFDFDKVKAFLAPADAPAIGRNKTLDDQIKLERLQAMRLAAADKAGALVPVAQLQDVLGTLFAAMSADLVSFVNRQAREQAWPAVVKAAELRKLVDLQRGFVAKAPGLLDSLDLAPVTIGDDEPAPESLTHAAG